MTALLPEAVGIDVHLLNLVRALAELDSRNRYYLFINSADRERVRDQLPANFRVLAISARPRVLRLFAQQVLIPLLSLFLRLDVIHSPSFIMPLVRGRSRHLLTIHDMTFFTLPDYHVALRRSRAFRKAVLWSIRRADLVCVPSEHVAKEVVRIAPATQASRIRTIPWGIGEEFSPQPEADIQKVRTRLKLTSPYILNVGTIEPRKNLLLLLDSYRRLVREHDIQEHLVLSGKLGWGYEELLEQVDSDELRDRVHMPEYVPATYLPALYSGARLFVYPSVEEGFGFPPLEAMACGVPVVSSQSSSLAENLQGAAELVSPSDGQALTDAMLRLLRDEALRRQRIHSGRERAAGFTWKEAARKTHECYTQLAAGSST